MLERGESGMRERAVLAAVLLTIAAPAQGQLAQPTQRCVDAYNSTLRLVSLQAGKSARSCLRDAARGTVSDPDGCVAADRNGRIAKREARVEALYSRGTCTGTEPIQRGASIGNAAHRSAATGLVRDLFGDPVTSAVIEVSGDETRCLDMVLKRSVQSFAAITTAHRLCKATGLRSGAVVDAATLGASCGTFAQVDIDGRAQARLTQLAGDVGAACGASDASLATLFPGLDAPCHVDGSALGGCVAARTRCRACLALNEADGQHIDCDRFDDGAGNDSCVADALGTQVCAFAPGSQLYIRNTALPLVLVATGAATVSCGTTDAAQAATCACELASFSPVVLPAIGDVCIAPATGCPAGDIDCDGGPPRGIDAPADHNIGPCGSNAACAAACDAHCAALGATYGRTAASCEGFCQGGVADELPCVQDSSCPGGYCVGANPVNHAGVCNCLCEGAGLGPPGGAGELACALGLQVHVELPPDGDCLDAPVEILPPRCVGVTTAIASASNTDAENMPGFVFPTTDLSAGGAALPCSAIAGGSLSGMRLVGHTVLFDSALGDNFARLTLVCQ
jgi:hypothetical protein